MAVVLVTGGNRGIGAACVEWFLANGDQVAATFRAAAPPAPPEGHDGARFLAVRCDVTQGDQVESAFATIESTWGPVEVLVANAGITRDGLMLKRRSPR
jgi:3-oxoacyl-[acyl-carrier protein] reductase